MCIFPHILETQHVLYEVRLHWTLSHLVFMTSLWAMSVLPISILRMKTRLGQVECLDKWQEKNSDTRFSTRRNLKWFFHSTKLKSNYRDWSAKSMLQRLGSSPCNYTRSGEPGRNDRQPIPVEESRLLLKQQQVSTSKSSHFWKINQS